MINNTRRWWDRPNYHGDGVYYPKRQLISTFATGMGRYGGMGAYKVSNSLIRGGRMAPRTIAKNDETDTITITDCEFVKDIFAPNIPEPAPGSCHVASGFAQQQLQVNPGLAGFAPNLSQIAGNYSEYVIKQLVFELRPVISENNVNNGQTGTAMLVFNYNPNEDPYDNKEDIMQAHGSVSGRIVDHIRCGVECDPKKNKDSNFFVRTGPVPYGKDNDEYDLGVLTLATNNIPYQFSDQQLYELWVYYTVELRKRKSGALKLNNQQRDLFVCHTDTSALATIAAGVPNLQFNATQNGILKAQQNNLGCMLSSPQAGQWQVEFLPEVNGLFEVRLAIEGTNLDIIGSSSVVIDGNVSLVSDIYATNHSNTLVPEASQYVASGTQLLYICHVRVRSATGSCGNTVRLNLTGLSGGNPVVNATCKQWTFEILEYTGQFAQSKTKPAPLLVNLQDSTVVGIA